MLRFFVRPALSSEAVARLQENTEKNLGIKLSNILTEFCIYVQVSANMCTEELTVLQWLLTETFRKNDFSTTSFLPSDYQHLEVGPRLNFETSWSSTAVSGVVSCGVNKATRFSRSIRFGLSGSLDKQQAAAFLAPLHDRMTQVEYPEPLQDFGVVQEPEPVRIIPVIENGIEALQAIDKQLGLSMDVQDLDIWYNLFAEYLGRNPTDVEIFYLGAAHSEHCRHGFFKGLIYIDDVRMTASFMQIVKTPWQKNPGNSVIAFCDDSSAIRGFDILTLLPRNPGRPIA
jgi:phosphoribosylformylglycinamidine synthase